MKINSVNSYNYSNNYTPVSNPNFKWWNRTVLKQFGPYIKYRNNTGVYRIDLNWSSAINFLLDKYKNVPKVNVYDYACSNGSEAYTIIMELLTHGTQSEKFFPIIAKDIDEVAINYAQNGPIPLEEYEIKLVQKHTQKPVDYYFQEIDIDNNFVEERVEKQRYYIPKDILKQRVVFSVADILKDLENIEPNNTVIFARNFWPYLNYNMQNKLVKNLYKNLGNNSTVILGNFDTELCRYPICSSMISAGFTYPKTNIFEKKGAFHPNIKKWVFFLKHKE